MESKYSVLTTVLLFSFLFFPSRLPYDIVEEIASYLQWAQPPADFTGIDSITLQAILLNYAVSDWPIWSANGHKASL